MLQVLQVDYISTKQQLTRNRTAAQKDTHLFPAGPVQLEALSLLSHAREPVLWVWKSHRDTGNALKASEPETERRGSCFAGFSYTEVKATVTGLL